ncbi:MULTISPECIES: hypothetical protein [Salipiger]|uniref:hypothetical protein n=1 Tax=Salipiger TaxID=263377 RepID=UPI003513662E
MPDYSKIFTYETGGLSYTVSLYEEDGILLADIEVLEGAMNVNAVYFGDDDFSGKSASLDGPLNMNGAKLDGEKVQWDGAQEVSDPGLGNSDPDGEDTYISSGDTLTISIEGVSIDEIDVLGIRATSTSTEEGSIKAVSDGPEEPEDPEEPTLEKVLFATDVSETGEVTDGVILLAEPNPEWGIALPEGTEPTFANYLDYYENEVDGYDIESIESIKFYSIHEDGYPVEQFSIDAPEDGFMSSEEVLDAYDAAIEAGALDEASGADLIVALSLPEDIEDESATDELDLEDHFEVV